MPDDSFHVYDTTLRDGAQQEGLTLTVADKLARVNDVQTTAEDVLITSGSSGGIATDRRSRRMTGSLSARGVGDAIMEEFVGALKRPRKAQIMVKAGAPVDAVIGQLAPLLEKYR